MQTRTKLSVYLEIIAWILAGAVLLGALLYFNVFQKNESLRVYGEGEECFNFEAELYRNAGCDGGTYTPKVSRGQITVLNFWYISCGPCLAELPHFNDVQAEFGDRIRVIALHSHSADSERDKQDFINKNFADYVISFAQDTENFKIFEHLGGKNAYPMTVILDQNGIIRFIRQGGMGKEELKTEIEKLLTP